MTQGGNFTTFT